MKLNLKKTIAGISALALAATQLTVMAANAETSSSKVIDLDSVTKFEKAGAKIEGDTAYVTWNKKAYEAFNSASGKAGEVTTNYGTLEYEVDGGTIYLDGTVDLSENLASKMKSQIESKLEGYTIDDSVISVEGNINVELEYGTLEDGYTIGVAKAEYKDGDTTINLTSSDNVETVKSYTSAKIDEIVANIEADIKTKIDADAEEEFNVQYPAKIKEKIREAVLEEIASDPTYSQATDEQKEEMIANYEEENYDRLYSENEAAAREEVQKIVDEKYNEKRADIQTTVDEYKEKADAQISKLDKTVTVSNAATADDAFAEVGKQSGVSSITSVDTFFSNGTIGSWIVRGLEIVSSEAEKASDGKYSVDITSSDVQDFVKTGTNVTASGTTSSASIEFTFDDGEDTLTVDDITYDIVGGKLFEASYNGSSVEVQVSAKIKEKEETTETEESSETDTDAPETTDVTEPDTSVTTADPKTTTTADSKTTTTADPKTTTTADPKTTTTADPKTTTTADPKTTTTAPGTDDGKKTTTTTAIAFDDIKNAKVVYTEADANANFYFSVDTAYTFAISATVNGKEVTLDSSNISYKLGDKVVKSPAETFTAGTHKYELDVLYNGKSLGVKATAYIGVRGDADLSDAADSKDAVKVLQWFASYIANHEPASKADWPAMYDGEDKNLNKLALFLANANLSEDSFCDSKDAVLILQYFAAVIANNDSTDGVSWDKLGSK